MGLVCILLQALLILLIVYVVFSWIPRPPEPLLPFVRAVDRIVTPALEPLRRVLPPIRLGSVALDLSILVPFFLIAIIQNVIGC